jgi:hypothetical protein
MPVSFLTAEQRSRYGVFNAVPDIAQRAPSSTWMPTTGAGR